MHHYPTIGFAFGAAVRLERHLTAYRSALCLGAKPFETLELTGASDIDRCQALVIDATIENELVPHLLRMWEVRPARPPLLVTFMSQAGVPGDVPEGIVAVGYRNAIHLQGLIGRIFVTGGRGWSILPVP